MKQVFPMQKLCIPFLILVFIPLVLLAQVKPKEYTSYTVEISDEYPKRLFFEQLTYRKGLPRGTVSQVLIDKKGYCWINIAATCLARYDGLEFKTYYHIPNDSSSLSGNSITRMYEDKKGVLWLSTTAGLCRYDAEKDAFKTFNKELGSSDNKLDFFFEDKQECFWIISSSKKIFVFDKKKEKFISPFTPKKVFNKKTERYSNKALSWFSVIEQDSKGNFWFAATVDGKGICVYEPKRDELVFYPLPRDLQKQDFYVVFPDENAQVVWVGGWGWGLFKLSLATLEWEQYYMQAKNKPYLAENSILDIHSKNKEELWLGTQSGLLIFNKKTNFFYAIPHQANDPYSPLPGFFQYIYKDRFGNCWVGGREGLCKLNPYNQQFSYTKIVPDDLFTSYIYKDAGLNLVFYAALNETIGLNSIYSYHKGSGKISSKSYPLLEKNKPDSYFWFIEKDKKGRHWVGGDRGLFYLNPETLELSPIRSKIQNNPQLTTDKIAYRMITQSKNGDLWLATTGFGLIHYQFQTGIFTQYTEPAIIQNILRYVFADNKDNIWISSLQYSKGINRINSKTLQIRLFEKNVKKPGYLQESEVYGFTEDKKGIIWVATSSGLCYYNPKNDAFSRVKGLNTQVFYVAADKKGAIWMKTTAGLCRYQPAQKKLKFFDENTGLDLDFFAERMNVTLDGEVFLSDNYRFYPENIRDNPYAPLIRFKSFKVFEKELKLPLDINYVKELSLTYQQNFFTIEFIGISFTQAAKNTFAYRLEGINQGWVYCGTRGTASYTNLPGGTYYFKVKSANNDGLWGKEISLKITIYPPFWKTLWFRIMVFCFLFMMLFLFYQNRLRAVKRKAEFRKKEEEFKRKIAETEMAALRAQMNPHFIFNALSSIHHFTLSHDAQSAARYLTKFAQLMRLILENSNSEKVTLTKELKAIELYIDMEKMRFQNKFDCKIKIEEKLETDEIQIPPLLLQPFIENSIWHGLMHKFEKGNIQIEIKSSYENILYVSIEDDGIGRAKAKELKSKSSLHKKSFGMQITSNRIKLINELYKSNTQMNVSDLFDNQGEASGTRVELWIPY